MHSRSIEFAKKFDVPVMVRSSFSDVEGTWIVPEAAWMREQDVCGVAMRFGALPTTETLVVNPIGCVAHGVCAELLPELITLDEWGYPVIAPGPIAEHLRTSVRRAVAACPALALKLTRSEEPARSA